MSDRAPRPDAAEKVLGAGLYTDDIRLDGMVHARALRSAYPRAVVESVDVRRARAHPGCLAVLTAADVPENVIGHLVDDWDVLIAEGDTTRYVGDALALVVCEDEESLDEVLDLVDVRYTELEPVTTPEAALAPDAPRIHPGGNLLTREVVDRGDADAALAASAFVVSNVFHTSWQEHAFLEPECAVARPWGDGGVEVFTSGQSVYDEQREIARMLGLPPERVHAHSMLVGGGFGGKEDMSVQHHAALAAWYTGRPVKVKFSRRESLAYHVKRHPMDIEMTLGCDAAGRLTALKARIVADTGAYASLGGPVLQRAVTHAGGPYDYQDFHCEGLAVYTNNPVAGAFRGFGVAQSAFALESSVNLLAAEAGIDPWEFRHRNAVRPGQEMPNGQIADEAVGLVECLEALKPDYDADPGAGLAVAFKNSGLGMGVPDTGRALLSTRPAPSTSRRACRPSRGRCSRESSPRSPTPSGPPRRTRSATSPTGTEPSWSTWRRTAGCARWSRPTTRAPSSTSRRCRGRSRAASSWASGTPSPRSSSSSTAARRRSSPSSASSAPRRRPRWRCARSGGRASCPTPTAPRGSGRSA
jgi:aldehyde oxidoreductase